jgi:hypothetical protein
MTATSGDQGGKGMQQQILPRDGGRYVDQFWSGMYSTLCSFAQTEARLVWMRYSAFLIVHGLLFNFVKDQIHNHTLVLVASLVGLIICSIWAFLNHCGWTNQNLYLWHAAQLKFSMDLTLPTDHFVGQQPPPPGDSIYWTAQLLPITLGIIDCFGIYVGAEKITANITYRVAIALLAAAISVIAVVSRCQKVHGRPIFA